MDPTRRTMMATGGAALAVAAASPQAIGRYPDPAVEVLDPSFAKYRLFNAALEQLATGMRWSEGPVWFGDGRYVLWSDIPNNRIMRWDEETRQVSEFRRPSNYANGNTRDRQGRLVTCEHGGRRVVRTEYDGSITVILDKFEGKPLNSPNDVVVKSDGSIWFTDPPFGIGGHYEGHQATPELPMNVYRVDPNGQASVVAENLRGPNGLAFSPDESILYVNDSRRGHIRAFDMLPNGTIARQTDRVFADLRGAEPGVPDGMKVDVAGNVYCGGSGGLYILDPKGKKLGRIVHGQPATTNLGFGGDDWKTLFFTSRVHLGSVNLKIAGIPVPVAKKA